MSVLLTGAGGFLGSHVLKSLLWTNPAAKIVCVDSKQHASWADRISSVLVQEHRTEWWDRVLVLHHDLREPFTPSEIRRAHLENIEVVVNLASHCQVDQSIRMPGDFILNNVAITTQMLEFVRQVGARFVQMSTDEVYGWYEAPQHVPSSPYAASKAAQEDIVHAYVRTFGVHTNLVVSCNMFGERQSLLAYIPKIMRAIVKGECLKVHVGGTRWYNYAPNVAAYIGKLAFEKTVGGRHNLYGQRLVDNLELVRLIGEIVGKEPQYETVDPFMDRPSYDQSYSKLPDNPLWCPKISFEEGLERTVRWFLANPKWLEG